MTDSTTDTRNSHIRYWIIAVLFIVSSINYASRATLSFAAVPLSKEITISTVQLGYIFSAFGWSYVAGQIPGGALLDRYGSRPIYLWSITLWAVFTMAQAFVSSLAFIPVFISLFALRFALGFAESPSFPANARIVANWFPHSERGTASAIFNSSQYFSLVAFAPMMGWLAQNYGWRTAGVYTLNDILEELRKPGRDPRDKFLAPTFKENVKEIADLQAGMTLEGVVTNVTKFGAFVDVGVHQDGLVHISELSDRYIKEPGDVVKVGQIVKVHVLSVDPKNKRIALSMKTQGPKAKVAGGPVEKSSAAVPRTQATKTPPPKPQPTMDDKLAALADRWKRR